MHKVFCSWVF